MHDLDRTQLEAEEAYIDEFEEDYDDEYENEEDDEDDDESEDEFEDAYDDEFDDEDDDEDDDEFEDAYDDEFEEDYDDEYDDVLDPETELELTEDLLDVEDDEEMEHFLGALISTVAPFAMKAIGGLFRGGRRRRRRPRHHRHHHHRRPRRRQHHHHYPRRHHHHPRYRRYPRYGHRHHELEMESEQFLGSLIRKALPLARRFLGSKTGRALTSRLRSKARQILPGLAGRVGGYIGGRFGRRGAGQRIGKWAGKHAVRCLGLEYELEGLPPEEMEFEAARQFVKFAADATKRAMLAPKDAPSKAVVAKAIKKAAKKHAPGLVKKSASSKEYFISPSLTGKKRSGKWVRKGSRIVVAGV